MLKVLSQHFLGFYNKNNNVKQKESAYNVLKKTEIL